MLHEMVSSGQVFASTITYKDSIYIPTIHFVGIILPLDRKARTIKWRRYDGRHENRIDDYANMAGCGLRRSCSKKTLSMAISAGVTPGMRAACPNVTG